VEIMSVVDEGLGHSSYLVDLGDARGLVIDPPRIPTRLRALAAERGLEICWTADTHSHADYVSGSPELAATGVTFLASRAARLEIPHVGVSGGDEVALAERVVLRVIATPGHTPDHLAYLLVDDGVPVALFSGGSLMVGTVGRTDLLGPDLRAELARRLFRSLREVLTLPGELAVFPTHGAGSFCSSPGAAERTTTIGRERATNPMLALDDEDRFVDALLAGFGTFPAYFSRLPELNRRGPRLYGTLPSLARLDLDTFRRAVAHGAQLVDARSIRQFADAHIPGALSIQLRPVFASWLGWLADPQRPIVFVLDDDQDRDELVRQCLTIGHEQLAGELAAGLATWQEAGRPTVGIPLVSAARLSGTVVDVRQRDEWDRGHLPGALHVELGALPHTPLADDPVTVMCGHGERAMTAASILTARGHRHVSVLDGGPDTWAAATGHSLETGR
jgi:glyoxylase-like metal-dependent hydrolase (beta-lactamase superfamily II)/rhodanese-related sulfurtransferase